MNISNSKLYKSYSSSLQRPSNYRVVVVRIKSSLGKKYSKSIKLGDVRTRLEHEFENLQCEEGSDDIAETIDHVDQNISKFFLNITREEEVIKSIGTVGEETESDSEIYSLRTLTDCSTVSNIK